MSLATRRSASARCSRCAISPRIGRSTRPGPRRSSAMARAVSRSAGPRDPGPSPTISRTPQGRPRPGIATASSGRPSERTGRVPSWSGSVRSAPGRSIRADRRQLPPVGRTARGEGLAQDPEADRQVGHPERLRGLRRRHGPGHQPVAASFPDGNEVMAVGVRGSPAPRPAAARPSAPTVIPSRAMLEATVRSRRWRSRSSGSMLDGAAGLRQRDHAPPDRPGSPGPPCAGRGPVGQRSARRPRCRPGARPRPGSAAGRPGGSDGRPAG